LLQIKSGVVIPGWPPGKAWTWVAAGFGRKLRAVGSPLPNLAFICCTTVAPGERDFEA